ncbi:PDZ domain-containing protein [Stieleria marina]
MADAKPAKETAAKKPEADKPAKPVMKDESPKVADAEPVKQPVPAAAPAAKTAAPGFLGVKCDGRVTETAARVTGVYAGGAAEAADLKVGDDIVQVGTVTIANFNDLRSVMTGLKAGDEVLIQVRRDGKMVTTKLTLGAAPQ